MTDSINAVPFWDVVFDADGDIDTGLRDTLLTEVAAHGVTDLYVFSHGWNNDRGTARRLYDGFLGLLAGQLAAAPADPPVVPGFTGVFWPSRRWSDEPVPDFRPAAAAPAGGLAAAVERPADVVVEPTVDDGTLAGLLATFPAAKAPLERMSSLLDGAPTEAAQDEFLACLREFSTLAAVPGDDGEREPGTDPAVPRMLTDDDGSLFERYADALADSGAVLPGESGGGTAGIGSALRGVWNGAKEALRTATYWEMKNRSGVVGGKGLGPLLNQLSTAAPGIRVHLIGHSFGARLVSYALTALPDDGSSPVASVTLLEGAFSHFAFTRSLPFDAGRNGKLAGMEHRIQGPLTVCFSTHDDAVGRFYPLASLAARDDTAGANSPLYRWGGMGADGAQNGDAALDSVQGAGATYRFARNRVLNVDTSDIVCRGGAPSGAHSDIVHPELTWIVLAASRA
jgi:pimeloyl-ACP methyl ester carboxylesterase